MIFLSYRVADAAHLVGRLRDALIATYGTDAVVFRDKTGLTGGDDWGKKLIAEVQARPIFLPVIGPGWADARFTDGDRQGELRLDDPDDWVRKEIRSALDDAVKIIVPLRMDDTKLRSKEWLARRGLGELAAFQGVPICDDPRYQDDFRRLTELLEEKHPPLKTLRESLRHKPRQVKPQAASLPAKPPVCVGRDDILLRLENLFLPTDDCAPLPRFAIAGVGGIGKSTAILWFLHDERVKARYGDNRHFVPLDGATSRAGVVAKLAEYLGIEPGPNLEPRVLAVLEGERRLLVLDNAETPLQSDDRPNVEELLGSMAHLANVGLVATLRPNIPLPNWTAPAQVEQLHPPHDSEAFHTHSGRKFVADADAAGFVRTLEGWPVVLRLAANHAKGFRSVREFRTVWDRKKTDLLAKGPDRASNLAVSMGLSRDAVRRENAHGERLLAVLARLPDGLLHDDLTAVLGEDGIEAAAAVRQVGGLMIEDDERMRMLAPLRDHLQPLLPFADADRDRAVEYYCGIAARGAEMGTEAAQSVIATLRPRLSACREMIQIGLATDGRERVYTAAQGLGRYGRFLRLDFSDSLWQAADSARAHGHIVHEADCLFQLGAIQADVLDNPSAAESSAARALTLSESVGHAEGQVRCNYLLGVLASRTADHRRGLGLLEQGRAMANRIGYHYMEAHCLEQIGELHYRRKEYAESTRHHELAYAAHRASGSLVGMGTSLSTLGQIALYTGQYDLARERLTNGRGLCVKAGSVRNEVVCLFNLGLLSKYTNDYDGGTAYFTEALQVYEALGMTKDRANTYYQLGELCSAHNKPDLAAAHYRQACDLYEAAGKPVEVAECLREIGHIHFKRIDYTSAAESYQKALRISQLHKDVLGEANALECLAAAADNLRDYDTSRTQYRAAIDLFLGLGEHFSVGWASRSLARRLEGEERRAAVAAARTAFIQANRQDLVSELDKEFPPDAAIC
jgi:tetratricopeptide (TPR) repeat protein